MENACFLKSNRPGVSWTGSVRLHSPALPTPFEQLQVCQSHAGSAYMCDHLDCLSKKKHGVLEKETSQKPPQ